MGHQPFWGSQEEIRQKVLTADVRYPPGLSEAAVHLMFCHWVAAGNDGRADGLYKVPSGYLTCENGPFIVDFPIKTSIYRGFPCLCEITIWYGWDLGFRTTPREKVLTKRFNMQ